MEVSREVVCLGDLKSRYGYVGTWGLGKPRRRGSGGAPIHCTGVGGFGEAAVRSASKTCPQISRDEYRK
eukprot:scaffold383_cov317-Prasinococcus_capsulatus_cf.AAC.4